MSSTDAQGHQCMGCFLYFTSSEELEAHIKEWQIRERNVFADNPECWSHEFGDVIPDVPTTTGNSTTLIKAEGEAVDTETQARSTPTDQPVAETQAAVRAQPSKGSEDVQKRGRKPRAPRKNFAENRKLLPKPVLRKPKETQKPEPGSSTSVPSGRSNELGGPIGQFVESEKNADTIFCSVKTLKQPSADTSTSTKATSSSVQELATTTKNTTTAQCETEEQMTLTVPGWAVKGLYQLLAGAEAQMQAAQTPVQESITVQMPAGKTVATTSYTDVEDPKSSPTKEQGETKAEVVDEPNAQSSPKGSDSGDDSGDYSGDGLPLISPTQATPAKSSKKPLRCPYPGCPPFVFASRDTLKQHFQGHVPCDAECRRCGRRGEVCTFKLASKFIRHSYEKHRDSTPSSDMYDSGMRDQLKKQADAEMERLKGAGSSAENCIDLT